MTLAIRPELERRIADKVRSGRYASPDDVVATALAVLDRIEAAEPPRRAERVQAERDENIPADVAAERLWDRINRWRSERHETV